MIIQDWINILTIVVLVLMAVALIYAIVLLQRANRIVGKFDNLGSSVRGFISEVLPAVVNVSTIMAAIQGILSTFVESRSKQSKKDNRK